MCHLAEPETAQIVMMKASHNYDLCVLMQMGVG